MTTRAQIVAEARTWLNTRWVHQAMAKGQGVDCVGLLRGVGLAVGLVPENWQTLPHVNEFENYSRLPHDKQLERGVALWLERIKPEDAQPGDLVVMKYSGEPHHMGILGDYVDGGLSLIHAYAKRRMVVETRLDEDLRSRIVSYHSFPGVQP